MKEFLTLVKNLVFPPRCAGCHTLLPPDATGESAVFCAECAKEWHAELCLQCPSCFAAYPECRCQPGMMKKAGSEGLLKLAPYGDTPRERVVRRIVLDLKGNPRRRVLNMLARELAVSLCLELEKLGWKRDDTVLVHLPRDPRSIRRHGADQAVLLARALAKETGLAYFPLLYRTKRVRQQKKLSAIERAHNLRDAFGVKECSTPKFAVLVDDVVTTGASLSAAVYALRKQGIKGVICVSIAQTPKKR